MFALLPGRTCHWTIYAGYGYLIGILLTTLLMHGINALGLAQDFTVLSLLLSVLIAGAGIVTWRSPSVRPPPPFHSPMAPWQRFSMFALLVVIGFRLGNLLLEIAYRPLFPWDAWATWAVKAPVWLELGHLTPFVDPQIWLQSQGAYTVDAWWYPDTVPLIQLWTALSLGRWIDTWVNLPWLVCAISLGLGFYGQARTWGCSPLWSMLFCYLLASLPIVNTSVALAGYADLWMATTYSLAAIALMQWVRTRDRGQAWLAFLMAGACPLIKEEGFLWQGTLLLALLAYICPPRILLLSILGLVAAAILFLFMDGFEATLLGLGQLIVTPDMIQIPGLGRHEISFHPVWQSFADNLFLLDNWHLLWYLVPMALLLLTGGTWRKSHWRAFHVLIASQLLLIFGIFFLTENYLWAQQYTSINRVLSHTVPVILFYIMTLGQFRLEQREPLRQPA